MKGTLTLKKSRKAGRGLLDITQTEKSAQSAAEATLGVLRERFPAVFSSPVPLAIGTRETLYAACPDLSKTNIRRALKKWCRKRQYQQGLADGVARVDIHGNPAGVVSSEEREHAKTRLGNPDEGGKHEE